MSLKLAKNNTPAYAYYSTGDGSDPVRAAAIVNGGGGSANSSVVAAYLVAETYRYTDIIVQPINDEPGIDWQVSLDNSDWYDSVAPADMDALSADIATPIWLRAVVANDGSIGTGIYSVPDIEIAYIENPE